jgi:peptidoglycan/LPS O-acetylase OafA/YrhL
MTTYRRDIDGLRGLAVSAVVLFHLDVSFLSGGFVGVDIFFVISGYLITSLIIKEIQNGSFSFKSFYKRRLRRIAPALLLAITTACLLAHALFFPPAHRRFGESVLSTLFFYSNILFAGGDGYFKEPEHTVPLLHTWSLSIEEQFYFLFPIFLVLVSRFFRGRFALAIGCGLVLSFTYSVFLVRSDAFHAFYSAWARSWELLLGAYLATEVYPRFGRRTADGAGLLGLLLIAYSVLTFSRDTTFPGHGALLPCLGAALVIISGKYNQAFVTRLLELRLFVWIGLISYSLYLSHWILFVFARYYLIRPLGVSEKMAILVASIALGFVSWKFIEQPARRMSDLVLKRRLIPAAAVLTIALSGYGVFSYSHTGIPRRFSPELNHIIFGKYDRWSRRGECGGRICKVGAEGSREKFLLWGDSHAAALAPAIEKIAAEGKLEGYVAAYGSCAPLLGMTRYDLKKDCAGFASSVLKAVKENGIKTVVLHARWALYVEGTWYKDEGREEKGPVRLTPDGDPTENKKVFETLFSNTLQALKDLGVEVTVVASVPEVGFDTPSVLARSIRFNHPLEISPRWTEFLSRQATTLEILRSLGGRFSARLVYPHRQLCNSMKCKVLENGRPIYWDDDHLSGFGASLLIPVIKPVIYTSGPRPAS